MASRQPYSLQKCQPLLTIHNSRDSWNVGISLVLTNKDKASISRWGEEHNSTIASRVAPVEVNQCSITKVCDATLNQYWSANSAIDSRDRSGTCNRGATKGKRGGQQLTCSGVSAAERMHTSPSAS